MPIINHSFVLKSHLSKIIGLNNLPLINFLLSKGKSIQLRIYSFTNYKVLIMAALQQIIEMMKLAHKVKPECVEVTRCEPMSKLVREAAQICGAPTGQCYLNAAKIAILLGDQGIKAKVVIGLAELLPGFVHGHGWLLIDGIHYDPTLELNGEIGISGVYGAIKEFSVDEVFAYSEENEHLPPYFPKALPDSCFTAGSGYPSKLPHSVFIS